MKAPKEETMNTILAHLPAYILSQSVWPQAPAETRPRSLVRDPLQNELRRAGRNAANPELATFGPVHLDVINRDQSLRFWRDVVGLQLRADGNVMEFGSDADTLAILHPVAKRQVQPGYSGLYHLAIDLPNEVEFARVLARLIARRIPVSAVDHVISESIYLHDPDGIGIEFALETPERFAGYSFNGNRIAIIDAEGRERSGRDPLNIVALTSRSPHRDIARPLPGEAKIGHVDLHVPDLNEAYAFYRRLGFIENAIFPEVGFGALGGGGTFKRRIGLNTWQGEGAPPAPYGTAGLRHFTVQFESLDRLDVALRHTPSAEKRSDGYAVRDPAGNRIVLTTQ
jgi:catechol 2,3-dioxygenase